MNPAVVAALAAGLLVLLWRPPPTGRALLVRRAASASAPADPGSGGPARVVVSAAVGLGLLALVPSAWMLAGAPVAAAASWLWLARTDNRGITRRRRRLDEQLPETLGLLASALSAGSPTRVAVAEVAMVSPAESRAVLETVASHIRVGRSEQQAWAGIAADPVLAPVWGPAARDLARNAISGAAVVAVLQTHADQARSQHRSEIEKQAKTVGIRSVLPLMTCFLPAFVLVGVVPIIAGLVGTYLP